MLKQLFNAESFFFKLLFYYNAMPLQLLFINIGIKQTLGISSFQTQRN